MRLARSAFAMLVRLVAGIQLAVDAGYRDAAAGRAGEAATVLDLPRPAIFYANHSSHLDFVAIWSVLPGAARRRTRPVAAADYWGSGLRGRWADAMFRPVLVTRGRGGERAGRPSSADAAPSAALSAAAAAAARGLRGQLAALGAALEDGDSLIIFPEGTRGDGAAIARFQAGIARLARAYPEVPLIPVALANLGRILPKGGLVPVPMLGSASFLPPIAPAEGEDDAAFLDRAREALVRALPDPAAEREAELAEDADRRTP